MREGFDVNLQSKFSEFLSSENTIIFKAVLHKSNLALLKARLM